MDEYIAIRREFFANLPSVPPDALKVWLVLLERQTAQKRLKVGLSIAELARRSDLGTESTLRALQWLETNDYLTVAPKGRAHIIELSQTFTNDECTPLPFTYTNTDEKKITTIEKELSRLEHEYTRYLKGREPDLATFYTGDKAAMLREIQGDIRRPLTANEAMLLGEIVGSFNHERIMQTWRKKAATAKHPIKALVALMWNQAAGKPAEPRELKEPPKLPRAL